LLTVDEEMSPGKKKSFQGVILSARNCARRLQELEGAGNEFEHLKLQAKSFFFATHRSG